MTLLVFFAEAISLCKFLDSCTMLLLLQFCQTLCRMDRSFFKFLSPKYGLELKTLLVGFLNKSKEGVGEYC